MARTDKAMRILSTQLELLRGGKNRIVKRMKSVHEHLTETLLKFVCH